MTTRSTKNRNYSVISGDLKIKKINYKRAFASYFTTSRINNQPPPPRAHLTFNYITNL